MKLPWVTRLLFAWRLLACFALACLLLLAGCRDTLNVDGSLGGWTVAVRKFEVRSAGYVRLTAGAEAFFHVEFETRPQVSTGPWTYAIDFGGAVAQNVSGVPVGTKSFDHLANFRSNAEDEEYTAVVRVTDQLGMTSNYQSVTFTVAGSDL